MVKYKKYGNCKKDVLGDKWGTSLLYPPKTTATGGLQMGSVLVSKPELFVIQVPMGLSVLV